MKKAVKKTKMRAFDKIMWGLNFLPFLGMAMLTSGDGVTQFFGTLFVLLGLSMWALTCEK